MKRTLIAILCLSGLLAGAASYADDVRIGYVDMRKVMNESKSGKRTVGEIEKAVKQRQEKLSADQEQLKKLQESYEKEKLTLSDTQKQAKQKEFEEKVRAFQEANGEVQREIQQREQEFTAKAIPQIRDIIRDLAKQEKLALVFEKGDLRVLYSGDGPDLTDKVIQRFDAKTGG